MGRDTIHALSVMGAQVVEFAWTCILTHSPLQVMLVMELAGNKDLLTHLATMRPKCVTIQVV